MAGKKSAPRKLTINVTLFAAPHPDPQRAIDLVANLVLKNFSKELEEVKASSEGGGSHESRTAYTAQICKPI